MNDSSAFDESKVLGAVATETGGETTAAEDELDVVNDSRVDEEEENSVPLSSMTAINTGKCTSCIYRYMYVHVHVNYYN